MKGIHVFVKMVLNNFQMSVLVCLCIQSMGVKAELSCSTNRTVQGGLFPSIVEAAIGGCEYMNHELNFVGRQSYTNFTRAFCSFENIPISQNVDIVCVVDGYFADANSLDQEAQNNGNKKPSTCNPVNLYNGNKYKIHTDIETDLDGELIRPAQLKGSDLFTIHY